MSEREKTLVSSIADNSGKLLDTLGGTIAHAVLAGVEIGKAMTAESPTPADPGVTSTPDSAA
jgi:hypothetical protein